MKIVLQISGDPTLERIASIALFRRLQDSYELYPGELAKSIRVGAKRHKTTPLDLLRELRTAIPEEFDYILGTVSNDLSRPNSNNGLTPGAKYSFEIRRKFKLHRAEMVKDYPKKALMLGVDVQDLISTIRKVIPLVIAEVLDEVEKILRKKDVE